MEGHRLELVRDGGIVEWYENGPLGIEQGFELAERPAGDGPLMLEVAVAGDLEPMATRARRRAALRTPGGETLLSYRDLYVEDADGLSVPARMEVQGSAIVLLVDDAAARYPLSVDPLVSSEREVLLSSTPAEHQHFGWAVAIAADGTRAVAAAAHGHYANSVRVFVNSETGWSEEAALPLPGAGDTGDEPGEIVAMSDDGSRVLVGSPYDDDVGPTDAGSARVYARSGTSWTEEATLTDPEPELDDLFGMSVALSSDGSRAIVGAPGDKTDGVPTGTARVFVRSDTTWTEEATLDPPPTFDRAGYSVALTSDGTRALMGAPLVDLAFVFARSGTSWSHETTLDPGASGSDTKDFGRSVAVSSDGTRALVGAATPPTSPETGSARVFVRSGTSWSEETKLEYSGTPIDVRFGWSVALSADATRALIGVPSDSPTLMGRIRANAGSARLFVRSGTSWSEKTTLIAPDTTTWDHLGHSVALTSDGGGALVGAPFDDTAAAMRAGSVRVFGVGAPTGAACSSAGECASGFCVDGLCCDEACGGDDPDDCRVCSAAAGASTDGVCESLAGCSTDAGVADAGTGDAGVPDAAVDAGGSADAGAATDGGGAPDAARPDGGAEPDRDGSGCGCTAPGARRTEHPWHLALVLVVGLALVGRRRSRLRRRALLTATCVALVGMGCTTPRDSGGVDAGGPFDADVDSSGRGDAGWADAGADDSGRSDAGRIDRGRDAGGAIDAGSEDGSARPVCGNGVIEGLEVCDDGNTEDGDGCSAHCLSDETCGNGIHDEAAGEQCDDGDSTSGDGCEDDCTFTCVEDSDCDGGDMCSEPVCGLGHVCETAPVPDGTVCDADGDAGTEDVCVDGTCVELTGCGDGYTDTEAGEECDDGNSMNGDGCDNDCTFTCTEDADCDDGMDCNGEETCDESTHECRGDGIIGLC